jgi:hypothetical protein
MASDTTACVQGAEDGDDGRGQGITLVMVAEVDSADFERFTELETRFGALFDDHGLVLRHRYRDAAAGAEVHVITAPGEQALESYFADPRRQTLLPEFRALHLRQRVFRVADVDR